MNDTLEIKFTKNKSHEKKHRNKHKNVIIQRLL